jgi:hypothetical protein
MLYLSDPLSWRKIPQAQSFEDVFLGGNGQRFADPQLIVNPRSAVQQSHNITV